MQLSFVESNRKTVKWYKKLAFHFFDMMLYNAYILYKLSKNEKKLQFRAYRLAVIRQIVEKFGLHRKRRTTTKKALDADSRLVDRHFPSVIPPGDNGKKKQKKCSVHQKSVNNPTIRRETIYECVKCNIPLCVVPCFEIYHTQKNF